ncbi:MAG: hypothetical protein QF679_02615 [Candidatus Pacebacteria bacterium]|jgi:hypothetical protein|nr:hypothetical protein [Candidatus Paceibacterota bacterium]|tara:strand:- start:18308 stop:18514 length:207 start_codon:yes stop_codon:yes gene_type:complete
MRVVVPNERKDTARDAFGRFSRKTPTEQRIDGSGMTILMCEVEQSKQVGFMAKADKLGFSATNRDKPS